MAVAEGRESRNAQSNAVLWNDDIEIDHGFGGQALHCRATDVLDGRRDVFDRGPDQGA